MFQVAVCDDEIEIRELMHHFFLQLSARMPYTFDIHYFSSGEELLQYYKNQKRYIFHFLILDVEMGGINGIETAQRIRSLPDHDVQIIFLTNYPEYMMESFDVQTFQYLIKPVSYELFEAKMAKLCNYILSSVNRFLTIKVEKEQLVFRYSDIIAIVKIKHALVQNKLKIVTLHRQLITTGTLTEYSRKLTFPFLLIHRSVIINLEHVLKFTATSVIMTNQEHYPLGRSRANCIKEAYAHYMVTKFKERG
ncbi:LytTR family DNA-binding domain-containing protein [Paenibacillus macerans]|uniref:LytR/AlgR family response regulator transcription factor n=1 Tax=Paenibacillus macerans TaxID=44252 RepID=UPI00203C9533|nr:LytTR family DNA-binding domain-containing protein [Paenibacillus macerans]MCM3702180.1 LytTR family DNA-binding domain-containing protein [Paenibacillus macerans]